MSDEISAKHILVDNEEAANFILKKIAEGESFEELAMEYSACPSGRRGGDLGQFSKGMMVKEFEDAVFSLKPGETTKTPVKTQFGYHIIKRTG
ncbi:MAG: peptidyl-prolyl cis-trans isomerase [Nanoarchaeota archaeon]|nr:peptidyl-prolyl cis-trans isomerase [Nanoarchaeota archaeon]